MTDVADQEILRRLVEEHAGNSMAETARCHPGMIESRLVLMDRCAMVLASIGVMTARGYCLDPAATTRHWAADLVLPSRVAADPDDLARAVAWVMENHPEPPRHAVDGGVIWVGARRWPVRFGDPWRTGSGMPAVSILGS